MEGRVMEGHARLATLMGAYPETAIYKGFGALNAQNLLYYQAELLHLEEQFHNQLTEDRRRSEDVDRKLFTKDWRTLSECCGDDGRPGTWQTFLKLRHCLRNYSTRAKIPQD